MKRNRAKIELDKLRRFIVCLMIFAIAFISMPFALLVKSNSAKAETAELEAGSATSNVRTSANETVEAIPDFTLIIYYYRPNKDYSGWNAWLWSAGGGDADYSNNQNGLPFTSTIIKSGKTIAYLEYEVKGCVPDDEGNAFGFLVRLNDWESKDVEDDRFITVDEINEYMLASRNTLPIYLVQGVKEIYFNITDMLTDKITQATFSDYKNISITTNAAIKSTSKFVIKDDQDTVCGTLDCSTTANNKYVGATTAVIPFTGTFDFDRSYTVYDESDSGFTQMSVQINKLYETNEFQEKFNYDGELGVNYSQEQSVFTVWSPTASAMTLNIYGSGSVSDTNRLQQISMTRGTKGEWTATVQGDLNGKYYTYTVGDSKEEIVDPYARSGGTDGKRGMILDLSSTNPEGWDTQSIPDYGTTANAMSKAVIWEAQLRDITIHESSGVSAANRGKFLGLTETGTTNSSGKSTALDYLKELGITQVHFQPLFDFATVNESFNVATYDKNGEYNWGYDPLNYNMPEGSYSSDPSKGEVRVNEMKQMVMALHNAGIQVIMDVVYNHVSNAAASNFEKLVPGYYFRMTSAGAYYNGSGCGNETASDHYMFRRFMIDSVKYWTEEYKIDGFRFDLMALHDVTTMNELYDELAKINPDVMVYGEGWTGGDSGLASFSAASQANAKLMPNIAVFNDIIRDGLKGSVFSITDTGYATGNKGYDAAVYVGAAGATDVLGSNVYKMLGSDKAYFAKNPTQNINYVAAHDNSALWDKINASVNKDKATLMAMYRLAATSVLTSQGASFFLAGEEMMRSKPTTKDGSSLYDNRPYSYLTNPDYYFSDNSYKSPDSVNAINWDNLNNSDTAAMMEYYKQLIAIKTTFPQFQIATTEQLAECLTICDDNYADGITAYAVKDPASDNYAVVVLNATDNTNSVTIPNGKYNIYVNGNKANATTALSTLNGSKVTVGAYSAVIMVGTLNSDTSLESWKLSSTIIDDEDGGNLGLALGLGIGIPVAVLIAGGVVFGVMYSKKKKGNGDKAENEAEASDDNKPEEDKASDETKSEDGEQAPNVKVEDAPADPPAAE